MGRVAVHPVAQGAIRSPVDVDIQEGKVAVSLRLHGELYGLHGVITQKKILFKTTAVKTSNPTYVNKLNHQFVSTYL
jgi:hypothetical protein